MTTLQPDFRPASAPEPVRSSNPRRWFAAAAAFALVSLTLVWYFTRPGAEQTYRTSVGEQRTVALDDGSVVYVNTDSLIEVRYTDHERRVRLEHGEALFTVEPDRGRPFRVHSGKTVVQAIGTTFNVRRISTQTKVAVIEGEVAVSGAGHLNMGQSMEIGEQGKAATRSVDVAQVTAWRQRRLVFEWESLGTIADEFNRYNRTPKIQVVGEDIKTRRYTAVFDADRPGSLLKFLEEDPALAFSEEGDAWVIRRR